MCSPAKDWHQALQHARWAAQEMRWSSSRLLSTLKGVKKPDTANIAEVVEPPETATTSGGPDREKWQRVQNSSDVLKFLAEGYPQIGSSHLEPLKQSTEDYLRGWETNLVRPSPKCDEILGSLIVSRERLTRDVAILACLHALSIPVATMHLVSLMALDVERYLRCVTLAAQANPGVASREELRVALSLLRILSDQGEHFTEFQHVIEVLGLAAPTILIPLKIIQSALARSGIRSRLQRELDSHLHQKKFMSTYLLISWLRRVPKIPNNTNIIALLDGHFPSWLCLIAWRPNKDRIGRWEHGKFTDVQRKKLSHAFDLDGPDIATYTRESLKMADPECYEHIHVNPQSTENLERFLDLLYRAHILGPGAVELFIHLCIDHPVNETALLMVDDCVKGGDDSYCNRLLMVLRALSPHSSLGHQMRALTQALLIPEHSQIPKTVHLSYEHVAVRLSDVMEAAQVAFCAQLEKGTGDYMGMLTFDLGKAILRASWIHASFPSNLLAQIRQFPSQDVLEAVFDQLEDRAESSSSEDSRFKSYLVSALGGRGGAGAGSMTLEAIRDEIQFWKHPPDTFRTDLARRLAKVRSMDYSLYTSCLLAMLKEDDFFIGEMRHMIRPENEQSCLNFAKYLAHRRGLNQLQNESWLLLLESLIRAQVPSFLPRMAESMSFDQWLKFVDDLTRLIAPVRSRLPQNGTGLTRERLSWWGTLSQNVTAMRFLLERQGGQGNLTWLYFQSPPSYIKDMLDIIRQGPSKVQSQIVSYLAHNGNNVASVCDCIRAITHTSAIGRAVCERLLFRKEITEEERWSEAGLNIVLDAWRRSESLTKVDKSALDHIGSLLKFPVRPQLHAAGSRSAYERLKSEYDALLLQARKLEILRLRLRHQRPQQISALLHRLGIDNTSSGRAVDAGVPEELFDSVELVGEAEYELSFALMHLSDIQRRARGISKNSRMLLVRLCLQDSPRFCIHLSPNDEGRGQHDYWRPADNRELCSAICTTRPNLFTYYLGRNLHQLLRKDYSLRNIHSAILQLITASPATCLFCSTPMGIKLWKPAACSKSCSIKLRTAPLEVRLQNLLVDTLSIDLLLTCVYAAAADQSDLTLLPGCPVQKSKIRSVIDSLPNLASLQTATDLQAAIRGNDECGRDREKLLSWLCLKFRGFILANPDGFRIPSMPNTQQFLMLNSNHEKEQLFKAQPGSQGGSGVVFHGTTILRLFLILTEGLKVMSNTPFMQNGAAYGQGIYCGNDQGGSLPYAHKIGRSWRNSALRNMSIMLGCELAAYTTPGSDGIHRISDGDRLIVRYVFLLPEGYNPPARHHVEPAMSISFATLRSGLLT